MSADFSRVAALISQSLEAHADRDGLTGIERGVFLARGGHAVGTRCPNDPSPEASQHHYWCPSPDDDECDCGGAR